MNRAEGLSSKKYGIMVHYLYGLQNGKRVYSNPSGITTSWEECVNDFDVNAFAENVYKTGAGYVIFTLCQVRANICAPSERFEEITDRGCVGACSKRDLPMELGIALKRYGIDLYLYFTGDGPHGDEIASKAFGTLKHTNERVTEEFVCKWASVMRELSVRYGRLVKGWWLDGCFDYIGYNDELLKYYRDAAVEGNPDSLISFNNGVVRLDMSDPQVIALSDGEAQMDKAINVINSKAIHGDETAKALLLRYDTPKKYRYSIHDDFTAGEATYFDEIPTVGTVDGCLWHVMSFLGQSYCMPLCGILCGWAAPGSRYSAAYIKKYTQEVNDAGGVVSFDVCVDRYGAIDKEQLAVLSHIKEIK